MTNFSPNQVRPPRKVLKVDCSARKRDMEERRSPEYIFFCGCQLREEAIREHKKRRVINTITPQFQI